MSAVEESYAGTQVRVFRLNRDAVVNALERAARQLVDARPEVLEVRLFGSLATGMARPGSDADVLVILSETAEPFLERIPRYGRFFGGAGVGCDVFVYTRDELVRLRRDRSSFVAELLQGRPLATRADGGDASNVAAPDLGR